LRGKEIALVKVTWGGPTGGSVRNMGARELDEGILS